MNPLQAMAVAQRCVLQSGLPINASCECGAFIELTTPVDSQLYSATLADVMQAVLVHVAELPDQHAPA